MTAHKRRGRPRKNRFFKGNAPNGKKRHVSALGQALKAGQEEFFQQLRHEFAAGAHIPLAAILDVKCYEEDPPDSTRRRDAEKEWNRVQSFNGGAARAVLNAERRKEIILEHADLFQRVKRGTHTANRAAELLRNRLKKADDDAWVPSIRTLNSWFADTVDENSGA
jgi:hypothetical protein